MSNAGKKVGYKSPPVKHQWKKGQSGNPSGSRRQKKPVAADQPILAHIADLLAEIVEVKTQGGKSRKLTIGHAIAMKTVHEFMAAPLKEKLGAYKTFDHLGVFDRQEARIAESGDEDIFTEEDRRMLEIITRAAEANR